MLEDDYLLRMVRQLGDFLARIRARRQEGDVEGALDEIDAAWDDLLGRDAELYRSMDALTLTGLCRHREKAKAVAALCREEAAVYEADGDAEAARALRERARAIFARTLEAFPGREDDRECVEAIAALDCELGRSA